MNRLFTLLLLMSLFSYTLGAQTLHALLFVNEQEQGRETDRRADMKNMFRFWGDIASAIGYDYAPEQFSDDEFTSDQVKLGISGLSVNPKDIVVFYFSGHGYNESDNLWPSLSMNDLSIKEIDILSRLKEVSADAKLVLCIADCCNKQYTSSYDVISSYDALESTREAAVRQLFTGFAGKKAIIMSASKQGQFSYSNLIYGAYFGISLRAAIAEINNERSATWDQVLSRAESLTRRYTNGRQVPQYNITQSGDPFEE